MDSNSDVETILAAVLDEVFVAADTSSLQSLRGQLLQLVGHQVNGEGEFVDSGLLTSKIKDPDFGIGDTTTKPRFWVRFVLTIAITSRWTTSHLEILREFKIRFDTGTTRAKRKLC